MLLPGIAGAQQKTAAGGTQALSVQVALDRAGFSPGEIDGLGGSKTRLALSAFQTANNLPSSGTADQATLAALHVAPEPTPASTRRVGKAPRGRH